MNSALLALIAGAATEIRPHVSIKIEPRTPEQGDMVQVQALFRNDRGESLTVAAIYFRIFDMTGREIYPASIIARHQAGTTMRFSTREFPPGTYNVQVSNHRNFSPVATSVMQVREKEEFVQFFGLPPLGFFSPIGARLGIIQPPVEIVATLRQEPAPLIPSARDMDGDQRIAQTTENVGGQFRVRWKTMRDSRVCSLCDPLDGRVWEEGDDSVPEIPVHPNCRCILEVLL